MTPQEALDKINDILKEANCFLKVVQNIEIVPKPEQPKPVEAEVVKEEVKAE